MESGKYDVFICCELYALRLNPYLLRIHKMSLVRYDTLDHSKITYKKPEKQGQVYYSEISYEQKPLLMITPKLVSLEEGSKIHSKSNTSILTEMMEHDFKFYDCMLKLDDRNIKETCSKSKEWFQKDIPLELIDDMYKRSNKPIKKGDKPTFQFKIPFLNEEPRCKIFDQYKSLTPIAMLQQGSEVECVIHMKGLKFLKQHYYCDCYISQIKLHVKQETNYHIPDTCLLSDEEDCEEIIDEEIIETLKREDKDAGRLSKKNEIQKNIDRVEKELKDLIVERDNIN